MLANPMDILNLFPVRRTAQQKEKFRDAVRGYAEKQGYTVTVEEAKKNCRNLIIGDPKTAKFLVTAHYDTPAASYFPNLITPTNIVTFLLWQIFVVVLFMVVAVVVTIPVGLISDYGMVHFWVWYIAYFAQLLILLYGPANKNNANDNTSGVVTLLEIARTLDKTHRSKVCFILFDLEEKGLVGSAAYRKAHKAETEKQIVLNLDCVGDGDHIVFFPSKKIKKDADLMQKLRFVGGWFGQKNISVHEKGFSHYPSDQKHFPMGVGIAAFHKKKGVGYYCSRIHTKKDTTLEITNVNLLRAALTTLICGEAVK